MSDSYEQGQDQKIEQQPEVPTPEMVTHVVMDSGDALRETVLNENNNEK